MKLEKIIIDGFRGYGERREIFISQMTAFIGRNDAGKSTILEALDAFFNDVVDSQDVNTKSSDRKFSIGCVFSSLPESINIDSTSNTTLSNEYLLNMERKLEIYKVYKSTSAKAELERVYAKAFAPNFVDVRDLLFKKRDDLRKIVDKEGIDVNKSRNPEMRWAIYEKYKNRGQFDLQEREVDLDIPKDKTGQFEESRKIWKKLNDRHLPIYTLFKSEQVRGDKESAVRSPLDATLKAAIKELDDEFRLIATKIEAAVSETTERTLKRLQQDYPEAARNLVPEYKAPSWAKAFDLDVLRGDDDVPLNKRGAGIRRLIVMAFFQAEAEKKRLEHAEGITSPPIIYAIEEPETSQHPNFQRKILQALEALTEAGDQVLLTTHVPGLAELLPTDSIRYVDKPEESTAPRVRSRRDDPNVLWEAAESLGVLPTTIPAQSPQIAVWVEGDTDVWVLDAIAEKMEEAGKLPQPLSKNKIYFVIGGSGDKLKTYINGKYLNALGLPQFYLRDSDKESTIGKAKKIPQDVEEKVLAWKKHGEGMPIAVVYTLKREIENYVDHKVIDRIIGKEINLDEKIGDIDWDYSQISKNNQSFWRSLCAAKEEMSFKYPETVRRGVEIDHRNPKHVICGILIPAMTIEEIFARCATTDAPKQEYCEIECWFREMANLVKSAKTQ